MTILRLLVTDRRVQGLAIGALFLLLLLALNRCARQAIDGAREAGRQEQRARDLQETITRTERANDAAETIRRNADARYDECLRHARNPGDC